jgi:hypothetical protein
MAPDGENPSLKLTIDESKNNRFLLSYQGDTDSKYGCWWRISHPVITEIQTLSTPPLASNISFIVSPNNIIYLSFDGEIGKPYHAQASVNGVDWIGLQDIDSGQTDIIPTNNPNNLRFFSPFSTTDIQCRVIGQTYIRKPVIMLSDYIERAYSNLPVVVVGSNILAYVSPMITNNCFTGVHYVRKIDSDSNAILNTNDAPIDYVLHSWPHKSSIPYGVISRTNVFFIKKFFDTTKYPDLTIIYPRMQSVGLFGLTNSIGVFYKNFTSNSCEVLEGCNQSGDRKLLTFELTVANFGEADFLPSRDMWEFDPCHGHDHIKDIVSFKLKTLSNQDLVVGKKMGFCLCGNVRIYGSGDCGFTGLKVGCGDVYRPTTPCQWLDITDVADGTYLFEVEVDPLKKINQGANIHTDKRIFGIEINGTNRLKLYEVVEKAWTQGYHIVSNPLSFKDNEATNLFHNPPDKFTIFKYTGLGFNGITYDNDIPGWEQKSVVLNLGEGFFIYCPTNYSNTFIGSVVSNTTNSLKSGYSIISSAYPENTIDTFPIMYGDTIFKWNGFGYNSYSYDQDAGGWTPLKPSFNIAEGFWFFNATGTNRIWVINK